MSSPAFGLDIAQSKRRHPTRISRKDADGISAEASEIRIICLGYLTNISRTGAFFTPGAGFAVVDSVVLAFFLAGAVLIFTLPETKNTDLV